MSFPATAATVRLIGKLQNQGELLPKDVAALVELPVVIAAVDAHQDIVRQGEPTGRCCFIIDGFACTYKTTRDGKRQITGFHIAGDIPDLHNLLLDIVDSSIGTNTRCTIGFIEHVAIRRLCDVNPRLALCFWRSSLVDAAIFREWMTNIGQRPAFGRIAHLLCELAVRMRSIGHDDGQLQFDLPMTQTEVADATGLSLVHVNRTIQEMRKAGLVSLRDGRLVIESWEGLRETADFDATYLHLKSH